MIYNHGFKNRTGPVSLTDHSSESVQSFRAKSVQTRIRLAKPVVRSANRINQIVPSEPSD